MPLIYNFGSINIDETYYIDGPLVSNGETVKAVKCLKSGGGKGANQSVAIAKAGGEVYHFGYIGQDGLFIKELMTSSGVKPDFIKVSDDDSLTGKAVIQVSNLTGDNNIILYTGLNDKLNLNDIKQVFNNIKQDSLILVQNEMKLTEQVVEIAGDKNLDIIYNPAPFDSSVLPFKLWSLLNLVIVNQPELISMSNHFNLTTQSNPSDLSIQLLKKLPNLSALITTLGSEGLILITKCQQITYLSSYNPPNGIKDTTGAGDTFVGYLVNELSKFNYNERYQIENLIKSCKISQMASAIQIGKEGAMNAVPLMEEVEMELKKTEIT